MKLYYAADNGFSSETDVGFFNTWYILAFDSKITRDKYVRESRQLGAHAIKKNKIKEYLRDKPRPFTKERYAIVLSAMHCHPKPYVPEGLIGEVKITYRWDPEYLQDLYQS